MYIYKFYARIVLAITCILFLSGCTSSTGDTSLITFGASKGSYAITVEGMGEVMAKKSYNIITPMLGWQALKISKLAEEGKMVEKGEIVVELESDVIANNYLTASNELEIAKADAQKRNTELELECLLLHSQVKSIEASVATSRLRLESLAFEPPKKQEIERLEIEKNEVELSKIKTKLVSMEAIQKEERARYRLKIEQELTKKQRAREQLDQLIVRAPVDGMFTYAKTRWGEKVKEGDQVYPRRPIAEIPDLSRMQLRLLIGETEAQKCVQGQTAIINIPAHVNQTVMGKVSKVARMANPIKRGSNVKKVEVLVDIDSTAVSIPLGISALGQIIVQKFDSVFTIPRECLFIKDSIKIVYMLDNNTFKPIPVMIEQNDEDFVIISGKMEQGVRLALQVPAENFIDWPGNWKQIIEEFKNGKNGSDRKRDISHQDSFPIHN